MELLDHLRQEHTRIDAVLGSLRTWARRLTTGEAAIEDREQFVNFFTIYAGAFHHEREEDLLIPALVQEAELPQDRGPIAVLLTDHARLGGILQAIATTSDPVALNELATSYSRELWAHIDIENWIFFPECEQRLRRAGIHELPARGLTEEELHAAAAGDALIARYPPMPPDIARGDGCVMCHAYGTTCEGLEREWWNEWEWEELSEHVAAT